MRFSRVQIIGAVIVLALILIICAVRIYVLTT